MGRHFLAVREIGSTNTVALALAGLDAPEGSVVVADYQTAGRGRQGRAWLAPPDTALLVSILLRPTGPAERIPQLSLVAGVAVREALALAGVETRLKWPNDILLHGKKVCGILLEAASGPLREPGVVVGIGLNVNQERADFAADLRQRATSLSVATGRAWERETLLMLLLSSMDRWYSTHRREGFAPVREAWLSGSGDLGRWIRVDSRGAGRMVDLGADGALIVETARGGRIEILAGEIEAHAPRR